MKDRRIPLPIAVAGVHVSQPDTNAPIYTTVITPHGCANNMKMIEVQNAPKQAGSTGKSGYRPLRKKYFTLDCHCVTKNAYPFRSNASKIVYDGSMKIER